jgi:hypothetical protein
MTHASRPTALSYKIVGGNPSEGVPMVSSPSVQSWYYNAFTLALPAAVKILKTSSTHITLIVQGAIQVGGYTFDVISDELYVYGPN